MSNSRRGFFRELASVVSTAKEAVEPVTPTDELPPGTAA